jgi:homoserine dehydrogenase
MKKIAILGFGVVGQGVANLISENYDEVKRLVGDDIEIKYILDLRDFENSPFQSRVIHDFSVIENDPEITLVCELMGGSHPAYEYTVRALKSGKSVITSNKEAVANFGEEFLALAKENSVSYRFEASCGGGIPVIDTIRNSLMQNKISEIRGILNGTTNYILTKMFSFGESFEASLADAQEKGYAERNPDADILGHDAARKIVILTALASGKLYSVDKIHTEGITKIRKADVVFAEKLGMNIKLIGRCILTDKSPLIFVCPFMVGASSALTCVSGVYNAVEIVSSPLDNVMLYGRGAGAGPTASAVVSDVCQSLKLGKLDTPTHFTRESGDILFDSFECKRYLAFDKKHELKLKSLFPSAVFFEGDECALIIEKMSEGEFRERLTALGEEPLSMIRLL